MTVHKPHSYCRALCMILYLQCSRPLQDQQSAGFAIGQDRKLTFILRLILMQRILCWLNYLHSFEQIADAFNLNQLISQRILIREKNEGWNISHAEVTEWIDEYENDVMLWPLQSPELNQPYAFRRFWSNILDDCPHHLHQNKWGNERRTEAVLVGQSY